MKIIDLRSDTVTKPSKEMLTAMFKADVGDDVYAEDPTVNALEEKAAKMFGMEAAIYCPSGTMTNQIGIKCHTQPGDEVICDQSAHVYFYEGGGIAFNSGSSVKLLHGNFGRFTAEQVEENINPDNIHAARTSLVVIENTSNRGGGSIWDFQEILKIKKVCEKNNLKLHLDGARLFNALVETNETALDYGKAFDSVSICLSKGLGAPVGSLLIGKSDYIKQARRVRKVFGGAMRQAGYLAAAGMYALDNNVSRLKEDHSRAKVLASALEKSELVESIMPVETNIVIAHLKKEFTAEGVLEKLKSQGILGGATGKHSIRFVTHLDFDDEMLDLVMNYFQNPLAIK